MDPTRTLPCRGLYVRTVYSFAIPEVLIAEDGVRSEFHQDTLLKRLRQNQPMAVQLQDFQPAKPIYDFTRPRQQYNEEFWGAFWPHTNDVYPIHFPFQARYSKTVARTADGSSIPLLSPDPRGPLIKCRYFPYGAASIHLTEYLEFTRQPTAREIVDLMYSPVLCGSTKTTLPAFFENIRQSITNQVVRKSENFYQPNRHAQTLVLHLMPDGPYDPVASWPDMATLLAMERYDNPDHAARYTQQNSANQGRAGQYIAFSPYTCLLVAPNLDAGWRRRRLRNHVGSVAELVAIQESYLEQLYNTYSQRMRNTSNKIGYPGEELSAFFHSYGDRLGKGLAGLACILDLQSPLQQLQSKRRWYAWYQSIAARMGDDLKQFNDLLAQLNAQNKAVGADVRTNVSGLIDKVSGLISSLPLPSK